MKPPDWNLIHQNENAERVLIIDEPRTRKKNKKSQEKTRNREKPRNHKKPKKSQENREITINHQTSHCLCFLFRHPLHFIPGVFQVRPIWNQATTHFQPTKITLAFFLGSITKTAQCPDFLFNNFHQTLKLQPNEPAISTQITPLQVSGFIVNFFIVKLPG